MHFAKMRKSSTGFWKNWTEPGYRANRHGHMPVAVKKGESPIKCNGKLFIIDGGFSKAYQATTELPDILWCQIPTNKDRCP